MTRPTIAWTGGCRPRPLSEISTDERATVKRLFREQAEVWTDYWCETLPFDIGRLFWRRARYDAHATFR